MKSPAPGHLLAEADAKDGSTSLGSKAQKGIMGTRLAGKVAIVTGGSRGQDASSFMTGAEPIIDGGDLAQ